MRRAWLIVGNWITIGVGIVSIVHFLQHDLASALILTPSHLCCLADTHLGP